MWLWLPWLIVLAVFVLLGLLIRAAHRNSGGPRP